MADVLAGRGEATYLYPTSRGSIARCIPSSPVADSTADGPRLTLVYGTAVGGEMILVRRADGTGSVTRIPLDHPVDITNGPNGSLACAGGGSLTRTRFGQRSRNGPRVRAVPLPGRPGAAGRPG